MRTAAPSCQVVFTAVHCSTYCLDPWPSSSKGSEHYVIKDMYWLEHHLLIVNSKQEMFLEFL